jgi:hypothetical protein
MEEAWGKVEGEIRSSKIDSLVAAEVVGVDVSEFSVVELVSSRGELSLEALGSPDKEESLMRRYRMGLALMAAFAAASVLKIDRKALGTEEVGSYYRCCGLAGSVICR